MALGAGVLGGVASLVSFAWMERPITNIFMAFMFAGLFVFGLVALRVKPMRRGNGLHVLAGLWWPLLVILAYVYSVYAAAGPSSSSGFHLPSSVMSICLALLLCVHADSHGGRSRSASGIKNAQFLTFYPARVKRKYGYCVHH
jgi:peptidoglycan/LPS O-acetylase OafA/YrhL